MSRRLRLGMGDKSQVAGLMATRANCWLNFHTPTKSWLAMMNFEFEKVDSKKA